MNIHSVIALCAGSVAFCVGIYHFMYSTRLRSRSVDLAFAGTCFAAGFYDVATALLYSSNTLAKGLVWQRWQFVLLCFLGAAFVWFVSEFIGRKSRRLDYLFVGYWCIQVVILAFDRSDLTIGATSSARSFDFFGHFPIVYYEGTEGVLTYVQSVIGGIACIYILYSLWEFSKRDEDHKATPIVLGVSIFIIGMVNDVFVAGGAYNFVYVMEVAFLFLLVCMGYSLSELHIKNQQRLHDTSVQLRKLEAAVEAAAETIVVTDLQGKIQYVNPAFERMTGYDRSEVAGQSVGIVKSGKHGEEMYKELWSTIKSGGVWRGQFTNRRKDGSLFREEAVISPVKNNKGDISSFVSVKRDVTQEVHLENQLRQSQKMEALGRLASGVAHDFTNMLAVILGHTQLLKSQFKDDEDTIKNLECICDSTSKLSALTGDLLAFAHQKPLSLRMSDLNKVIKGMMEMLNRSIGKDVDLVLNLCNGKLMSELDPSHIEQAIMYLVVNAVDVMPDGGTLTIESEEIRLTPREALQFQDGIREDDVAGGDFAVISVTDTGCGMSEEVRSRVFEPFFTTKGKSRTTGLGLSTAYGIVSQHNGKITVYSSPGHGTTFKIYLPLAEKCNIPKAKKPIGKVDIAGNTVLAVEDDYVIRRVLVNILQSIGYSVLEAEDSMQALNLFKNQKNGIGLLITDVMMPDIGGVQLAEELRDMQSDLKVIYASGYPEAHLRQLGILSNGSFVLRKPLTETAVAGAIAAVMNN